MACLLLSALTVVLGLIPPIECLPSPLFHLSMDSDILCDTLVGSPVNFTITGRSVRLQEGKVDKALEFHNQVAGEDAFLNTSQQYAIQTANFSDACADAQDCPNGFTLVGWTKLRVRAAGEASCNTILGRRGDTGQSMGVYTSPPDFHYVYYTAQTQTTRLRFVCLLSLDCEFEDFSEWVHWAVSADGPVDDPSTKFRMYKDCKKLNNCTVHIDPWSPTQQFTENTYVGCTQLYGDADNCYCGLHGQIDDVQMFDEKLSKSQIQDLCDAGSSSSSSSEED